MAPRLLLLLLVSLRPTATADAADPNAAWQARITTTATASARVNRRSMPSISELDKNDKPANWKGKQRDNRGQQ